MKVIGANLRNALRRFQELCKREIRIAWVLYFLFLVQSNMYLPPYMGGFLSFLWDIVPACIHVPLFIIVGIFTLLAFIFTGEYDRLTGWKRKVFTFMTALPAFMWGAIIFAYVMDYREPLLLGVSIASLLLSLCGIAFTVWKLWKSEAVEPVILFGVSLASLFLLSIPVFTLGGLPWYSYIALIGEGVICIFFVILGLVLQSEDMLVGPLAKYWQGLVLLLASVVVAYVTMKLGQSLGAVTHVEYKPSLSMSIEQKSIDQEFGVGLEEQFEDLNERLDRGVITQEEYERKKRSIEKRFELWARARPINEVSMLATIERARKPDEGVSVAAITMKAKKMGIETEGKTVEQILEEMNRKKEKQEALAWELEDQLKELKEQLDRGVITQEEYEQKKKLLEK